MKLTQKYVQLTEWPLNCAKPRKSYIFGTVAA